MKSIRTLFVILVLSLISGNVMANFTTARLKVTGVTCSMCSNSVHKALSSLPFIENINVDLQEAVYEITFKKGEKVVMDAIKSKVEGAGFSVGELTADFEFQDVKVSKDYHYQFQGNTYHFVNVKDQTLNNIVHLRFIDKGFTSKSEYKKYASLTSLKCIKTGKAENCCNTTNMQRIYHITL